MSDAHVEDGPCSVCTKIVSDQPALLCPFCNLWSHNKCNKITSKEYKIHQKNIDEPFCCQKCFEQIPFNSLNSTEFGTFSKFDVIETQNGSDIQLSPTPTQQIIIDKLNNLIQRQNFNQEDKDNDYSSVPDNEFDQPLTCSYFSCDDFVSAKIDANKNFSILHLNIHSIQRHVEELRVLLHALDFKFNIIAISESKLKVEPQVDITLPGYHPPHCKFTEAEKGGTILYISSNLVYKPRKDLEIYESKELESSFVEIMNKKSSNDIVGVIYRHPRMDTNVFIDNKLNHITNILAKEKNKKIYIAGDFNFDLLKYSNHSDTANFFDKMTSNLLVPLILVPTKINTKNDTLIDNIFSNQFNSQTITGNLTVNFSDGHLPSFAIFPKPNQNHLPKKHNIYVRGKLEGENKENFLIDLAAIDMANDVIVENDPDGSLNNLLTHTDNLTDRYLPAKKLTNKEFKQTVKPWITLGIRTSIKRKDKLYKKYINIEHSPTKEDIHTEYKTLKNRINSLIYHSKKNYYTKYFNQYSNNIKKIWTGIKNIINIKTKDHNAPNCIEVDNEIVTDNKKICDNFNQYFTTVADNILKNNKTPILKTFDKYLPERNSNSFVYEPCTPNEVYLLIEQLNPHKGTGPNGIHTEILKLINHLISDTLCKIFNMCITSGKHPDRLKLAHALPIFKKGSRLLVSNYRPISLLSNLNKILEKIMHKRIYAFLEKYELLYELQFGFRAGYSTTHALIHMTEAIRSALDSGSVTCGIFVDFQKAFDTVNHDILLKKLDHYGFRGVINSWFRSYLTDRKQKVVINGFESENKVLPHGVPQGSVLGPILFLIYINDLHRSIKYSTTYHFADDTNLLHISKDYKSLQKKVNYDLFSLHKWLTANKISLNDGKTELIYFRKSGIAPTLNIKLHGKTLTPSKFVKYLGVYLDEFLSGNTQCTELSKKLNRANGMLAKARHYVPEADLKNIYHAIFSSHILYGSQVWTSKLISVTDKISRLQKSAMRIMTFSEFRAHSEPLFKKLEILKFRDSISVNNCSFVYDYFHNNLPRSFTNTFFRSENLHNYSTRQATSGQLYKPSCKTTSFGLKCIYMRCIDSWNQYSNDINMMNRRQNTNNNEIQDIDLLKFSRPVLKEKLTKHILSTYED